MRRSSATFRPLDTDSRIIYFMVIRLAHGPKSQTVGGVNNRNYFADVELLSFSDWLFHFHALVKVLLQST